MGSGVSFHKECSNISTIPNTHFKIQREAADEKKMKFSTAITLNQKVEKLLLLIIIEKLLLLRIIGLVVSVEDLRSKLVGKYECWVRSQQN